MEDTVMKEKIAIDIDGVLNMIPAELLREGEIYFRKAPAFTNSVQDYQMYRLFGVTEEDEAGFWKKHLERLLQESKAQMYAADVIGSLREWGAEIILLTSRKSEYLGQPKLQRLTVNWLSENGIQYDRLVFEQEKAVFCKEQGIRFAVEDNPTLLAAYQKAGISTVGRLWYFNKCMRGMTLMGNWQRIGCTLRGWLSCPQKEKVYTTSLSYEEILKRYRVTTAERIWNPKEQKSVLVKEEDYDIILRSVGYGYAHKVYEVVKNAPRLDERSLALICDEGNLCFGYDVRGGKIVVYTD